MFCCCFCYTPTHPNTVFNRAIKFDRDLSAWDVRIVADMTDMFLGQNNSQSQSLCGYYWMQSSTAQLAFPTTLPQISVEKNGTICNCPRGTYYQSRVWPSNPVYQIYARLEACRPCSSGQYSRGGNDLAAICSDCPKGFYCVTPAVKAACPLGAYCPAKSTFPTSLTSGYYAVNVHDSFTEAQGVAQTECEGGYYCKGGNRILCPSGGFCPRGASSPRPCMKGYFCNATFIGNRVVWGTTENPCLPGNYCPEGTRAPLECPASASCSVPGAPELIISPSRVFEEFESNLVAYIDSFGVAVNDTFQFCYNLSLSVQPLKDVIIQIKMERSRNISCIQQDGRLSLVTTVLAFSKSNYSIPQAVIAVAKVRDKYEGPISVTFEHSVKTEDEG
jgi:hypothetical protein